VANAGEDGALLLGAVADRDENAEVLPAQVFGKALRALGGDVDAALLHDPDRQRVDAAWLQTGAEGLVTIAAVGSQKASAI